MQNMSDLRAILGETMRKVIDGQITVEQARAVAQVAQEVNNTAKIEVEMARATDGDFLGSGFIDVDYKRPNRLSHVRNQGAKMSEWQPIETAPKDGTVVDLWNYKLNMRCADCFMYDGEWSYLNDHFETVSIKGNDMFSHWMPLPEPPK